MLDISILSLITLVTVQYTLWTTQLSNNRLYSQRCEYVNMAQARGQG
jgi:ABC-type dipeptide/oligopeptide/nickel transport system permease component